MLYGISATDRRQEDRRLEVRDRLLELTAEAEQQVIPGLRLDRAGGH